MKSNPCLPLLPFFLILLFSASCSTTKMLPPGEVLYTGIERIVVNDPANQRHRGADEAMGKVEQALAYPPNNAFLGSSSIRTPLPIGLWVYNAHVGKKGRFHQWMYRWLAARPVTLTTVKPANRALAAQNVLHENGFFRGAARYEIIPDHKDSLKARVRYLVTLGEPYVIDSVRFRRMQDRGDTTIKWRDEERLLHRGDLFTLDRLEAERQRIATIMRNNGYYYFRPEYIEVQADSTKGDHLVDLRVRVRRDIPRDFIRKPWFLGRTAIRLIGYDGEEPTDSLTYRNVTIHYEGKLRLRPAVLRNALRYHRGDRYSLAAQEQTQAAMSKLRTFRFVDMQYTPTDTSAACDTMNVRIRATYDYPLNSRLEIKGTINDNRYAGPGFTLALTRMNLFRGGENLSASVFGSYEWQTGARTAGHTGMVNNYEIGARGTLTFPRLILPHFGHKDRDLIATSRIDAQATVLNRARFFNQLSFGGSISYDFVPNPIRRHTFTPLRLTFSRLLSTTSGFDSIVARNPSVRQSLQDQFIPVVEYTYTLDNSTVRDDRSKTRWYFSIAEAGNLLSATNLLFGQRWDEKYKTVFKNPYSQFLKMTTELRYNHYIDRHQRLAFRIGGGIIYSYGNASEAPYSEQFYVGGANSIRAFTIRSVGPGHFAPDKNDPYAYIDQIGDIKLEANAEYRFRIVGDLAGAFFLDVGNVWLLRDDPLRPGGQFKWKNLLSDLATGTGVGFRYDINLLVFRFDIGYALHFPYDTGRNGYFNAPNFRDAFGVHLALGYPF